MILIIYIIITYIAISLIDWIYQCVHNKHERNNLKYDNKKKRRKRK